MSNDRILDEDDSEPVAVVENPQGNFVDRTGEKRTQRERLEADVRAYMEAGKKVTKLDAGDSGFEYISTHASPKKGEKPKFNNPAI